MSRRAAITGITLALISEGGADADEATDMGFDYVNAEYPPVAPVDGQCPEGTAWDFQRKDRCVSMEGWCDGQLWTCAGKPAKHDHPQFVCLPGRKRHHRCARSWWPPIPEEVIPAGAEGNGRCWKYKPKRVAPPAV